MSKSSKKPALKSFQKTGVKFAKKNKYVLLAMDMGLGKTRTALESWKANSGKRLLVVAPASLTLNWKAEVFKWLGSKYKISVFTKGEHVHPVFDTDICIVSFDLGSRCEELVEWCDTLVIDEAQEIKTMTIKRTEFYHKTIYENSVPNVYLLTGTPIQNRVAEYYSLMCIMYYKVGRDSDFLERFPTAEDFADYFSWRKEFKIEVRGRRVKVVSWSGIRNVAELKEYLKPFYYRVKFEEVESLPPIVFKDILISEKADKQLLKEFETFKKYYDDEDNHKMDSRHKLRAANKMVPFTVAYAKTIIDQDEPLLIYSDHIESAEAIAAKFGVTAVTGKMAGPRKFASVKDFQDGKTKVLVATIGALNSGHNLTRACNIVFNDENWSWGKMYQVYGRIRRIGQTRTCVVHTMHGSPQSQKISNSLKEKGKVIGKAT